MPPSRVMCPGSRNSTARHADGNCSHHGQRIIAALERHNGRRGAAAEELGISRSTLWRKLYAHRLR
jgi:transcriptional regulator of acetoin/glycerol metabolism